MLVGLLGRAAAARVDHDDAPAALPDRAQAAAHVGRGQQAAVRGQRVGAQHQQVIGAVHVGDRDAERRSEHQPGGDVLGHLVDGGGREDVACAERLQQHAAVEERIEVVRVRVAEVGRRPRRGRAARGSASAGARSRANASSQDTSSKPVAVRTSGARTRSGSSCSGFRAAPFGHTKPWLKTSCASPRMRLTWPRLDGQLQAAGRLAQRAGAVGGDGVVHAVSWPPNPTARRCRAKSRAKVRSKEWPLVPIRARLGRWTSLFLVVWFLIAAAFGAWIVREWTARRDRRHR